MRSSTAWLRFIIVIITVLLLCSYAPSARYTVALRPSLCVIKSQIGSGSLQIIVKYLHRLMLSITLSTTSDFASRPHSEQSPVCASNTKQEAATIPRSTTNSAAPIFIVVYFFKIIATISVPPPEAPILNSTAELKAGRTMAYINSSTGSSVSGPSIGNSRSARLSATDISTLT